MGHGALGMGHWAWGIGHGALGKRHVIFLSVPDPLFPVPNMRCSVSYGFEVGVEFG